MASDFSFDLVSEVDMNLVSESVHIALKEILNRFDFKDAKATIELLEKDKKLDLRAVDDYRVKAALDVLYTRMAKRGLPLKNFAKGEVIEALGQTARLEVTIQAGIPMDKAKQIVADIKAKKFKVNASIQADQVRVSSKSKDELQSVMAMIRAGDYGVSLQFKNFR
ncbi:MAG: YajQ family cyclic di-GMP-binding protein [Elusimicrobia bacterium]|nr:YajQ family cyclic di-GMP-binding protein [Elusimicrobiota bacterium]